MKPTALSIALLCCCLLGGATAARAQGNVKTYKRNGIEFFKAARYANAADALQVYRRYKPDDDDIWYPLAVSHFKLNQLEEARKLFEGLVRTEKASDDVHLYLGRIAHHENRFAEAAKAYKRFLAEAGEKHELFASIVDDIRRVGYGERLGPNEGAVAAYSENLGPGVNTAGDEFHPLLSPNYQDRMYFASIREGVTGGYRDAAGMVDVEGGKLRADMFAARIDDGRWAGSESLSALLNSSDHDVALDFAREGQVLLFWKGESLYSGDIHVDTFRRQAEERNLFAPKWSPSPMDATRGDNDPFFFNDTTLLFASKRAGGYGGFDLYASTRRDGAWLPAKNLGPEINSAYDDRSPFLANDGRALYFSSNRVDASVGGFDLFKATFDDRAVAWRAPQNAGLAVNTAGDELNFRLSISGLEGYYDSSVRTGDNLGGRDIYVAYFKEQAREQQARSQPVTFLQVQEIARREALADGVPLDELGRPLPEAPVRDRVPVSVRLTPLPYGADDNVTTPGNIDKARPVLQFLDQYPGARVVVTAHTDDSDPDRFRTYFGIKRAEKFADYLIGRGVSPERIQVMSAGSHYPLADNVYNGQVSPQGQRLNRRLELHVVPAAEYALTREYDDPRVPDFIAADRVDTYRKQQEGPLFRVEVAQLGQRFDDDTWLRMPLPSIQSEGGSNVYSYNVGAYASYTSARQMAEEARRRGLQNARVVPYLDGLRLSAREVATFALRYPELAAYVDGEARADE